LPWQLQYLDAGERLRLQGLPQAHLFVLQLPIVLGAHQQLRPCPMAGRLGEQFVQIGFAIAHTNQRGIGAARLQ
jgi:hypothetical protein